MLSGTRVRALTAGVAVMLVASALLFGSTVSARSFQAPARATVQAQHLTNAVTVGHKKKKHHKSQVATDAAAFLTAYNGMLAADKINTNAMNSSDPTTSTDGINGIVLDHDTFDGTIQALSFPAADKTDARGTLNADAAYEAAMQTLALNTNDVDNYNGVFDTTIPLQSAFQSAVQALGGDLGITFSS